MTKQIKPDIDEANEIAKQLNQEVHFSISLRGQAQDDLPLNSGKTDFSEKQYKVEIKVNNTASEETYIWETNKFRDRLMVMRDLLSIYEDEGIIPDSAENPFIDKQEPLLIGSGQYMLQSLANMIDNPIQIVLIGTNFMNHGKLHVNLLPVDQNGVYDEDDEDMFIDEPEELLGRRLDFVVDIE